MKALLYYHTIRHLRPRQIVAQGIHHARRFLPAPAPPPVPERLPEARWTARTPFQPPVTGENTAPELLRGVFTFVGETRDLGWPPREPADASHLWRYNLHYHEWIWGLDFEEAAAAAEAWIEANPWADGTGWDPYPVSLRMMNWFGFFFARHAAETAARPELSRTLRRSLFLQAEWLSRRLEYRLMGNHLLENAAALVLAGSSVEGEAPQRWYARGLEVLQTEVAEQILPDGMHFELSPMYHARMLYVLNLIAQAGRDEAAQVVQKVLPAMRRALLCMTHGDGRIALFNDAAFGIAHEPADLCAGEAPPAGAWALPVAGYYGWRDPDEKTTLICDAGPIGPDYIPGHAHADFGSFELCVRGERLITDTGAGIYAPGPERAALRETAAHNTLRLGEESQCELWGAFRVARRGRTRMLRWEPRADGFLLDAVHDGWRRLEGEPAHRRCFVLKGRQLLIRDRVQGGGNLPVRASLVCAPDVVVTMAGKQSLRIQGSRSTALVKCRAWTFSRETSDVWLSFGRREEAVRVRLGLRDGGETPEMRICW